MQNNFCCLHTVIRTDGGIKISFVEIFPLKISLHESFKNSFKKKFNFILIMGAHGGMQKKIEIHSSSTIFGESFLSKCFLTAMSIYFA